MKSKASNPIDEVGQRKLPYLIQYGENVVFIDEADCGCVVHGPDLGKSYGECEIDHANAPLYNGVIELEND